MNNIRYTVAAIVAVAIAGSAHAADFMDDQFFNYNAIPAELTGRVVPGHDLDLNLEENATTGYLWNAAYDPRVVRVKIDHKAPRQQVNTVGVPGFAEIEIKPLTLQPAVVTLFYARPFEIGVTPIKSVKCVVTPITAMPIPAPVTEVPATPQPLNQIAAPAPAQPIAAPAPAQPIAAPADAKFLYDDASFRYSSVPAALRVDLPIGGDVDFDLEEKPEQGLFWSLQSYDPAVCIVKIKHDNDNDWFSRPEAEVEIKGVRPGFSLVTFVCGAPPAQKVVRCFVTVR